MYFYILFLFIVLTSFKSDYTRSQYTEKYIEDQVNARLQELAKSSSSTLKDLLEKSEPEEDNNTLSSSGLQAQLQQLKESLESRPERHVLNDDLKKSRSDIVACLKEFSNKPMKCVEQVEAFKAEVQKYEKSIL